MKMKKWSPQWTQFMQLRKEAWKKKKKKHKKKSEKIQDFNGVEVLNFFFRLLYPAIE